MINNSQALPSPEEGEEAELVYVYIPEALGPIDRGDKYEDPIDDELQARSLGCVSGAGCMLSDEQPDGSRHVVSCGIDVDTDDVAGTRAFLREHLMSLGCPAGTQLHYREGDVPLQDEFGGSDWVVAQPRTMMHPGFGI